MRDKAKDNWTVISLIGASKLAKMRRDGVEAVPQIAKLVNSSFSQSTPAMLAGAQDSQGSQGSHESQGSGHEWLASKGSQGSHVARVPEPASARLKTNLTVKVDDYVSPKRSPVSPSTPV